RGRAADRATPRGHLPDTWVRQDRRVPEATAPLPADRFLNREVSWLDFNARVLELAEDDALPLLERVKFLAIFASNLDEFFMVRIAGLKRRQSTGLTVRSPDGLTIREQLERIAIRTQELVQRHGDVFNKDVLPRLEDLIAAHLTQLFPGLEVESHHLFRVTRNADLEVEEDRDEDLLQALERELAQRRFGPAVRLEVTESIDPQILD